MPYANTMQARTQKHAKGAKYATAQLGQWGPLGQKYASLQQGWHRTTESYNSTTSAYTSQQSKPRKFYTCVSTLHKASCCATHYASLVSVPLTARVESGVPWEMGARPGLAGSAA